MFLGSSCCNIAENSTFARPLDFACRLNPSFHAFAEACATETLGAYVAISHRKNLPLIPHAMVLGASRELDKTGQDYHTYN